MDPNKKTIILVRDERTNRPIDSQKEYKFDISKTQSIDDIKLFLQKKIETLDFILCMPNRKPVTDQNLQDIRSRDTILILESIDQPFKDEVRYKVNIAPHPDTITKSGMYEYYSSRGIDSVVISIAELIDNSLAATKHNPDSRLIEIRFYDNHNDSLMCIIDNGHGMNNFELEEWAKFKNSKFVREYRFDDNRSSAFTQSTSQTDSGFNSSFNSTFSSSDLPLRPNLSSTPVASSSSLENKPRYLDSDINYFGAGGKQAIFNIGEKTTMTSKKSDNNDIHVMTLSKEEFDEKSKTNPDDVYKVELISRTKGVERRLPAGLITSSFIENEVIKEMETQYQSFTVCSIKNIITKHLKPLRKGTDSSSNWIKSLARIYHYYIHGPKGNIKLVNELPQYLKILNINIKIFNVLKTGGVITTQLRSTTNLREIDDDFETQLVRSAVATFEFDIQCEGKSNIEGVIRYHPYSHDHETLPRLNLDDELGETLSLFSHRTDATDFNTEDNEEFRRSEPMKTKDREVFECFWHGRLIPQTLIDFEWNKYNSKSNKKNIEECFNRLSGALFIDNSYEVSQNKQSFMDLNACMAQKNLLNFYKVIPESGGNRRHIRGSFETEFVKWIEKCHTDHDKQVKYLKCEGFINRTDDALPPMLKRYTRTEAFTYFSEIKWRNKTWKKGDKIKTKGTKPSGLLGVIERFLVPIKLNENIVSYEGSPGFVEISQLPAEIFGTASDAKKICLFSQINLEVSKKDIENELIKFMEMLPQKLVINFPRLHPIREADEIPAGRPIGDIQAFIQNKYGTNLKGKIPYKCIDKNKFRRLKLQLEILGIDSRNRTSVEVEYPICTYSPQWDSYWFTEKVEGIKKAGNYVLKAVAVIINDDNKTKEALGILPNGTELPTAKPIFFKIIAGPANRFIISGDKIPVSIGKPFSLSLKFFDEFDNVAKPALIPNIPLFLTISGFDVNYESVEVNENDDCVIKNIIVLGRIDVRGKEVIMEVSLPALKKKHEVLLLLNYGIPNNINVRPEERLEFVNGSVPNFDALVLDRGGNDLTFLSQLQVFCKFDEIKKNGQKSIISNKAEYPMIEGMRNKRRCLILRPQLPVIIKASDQSSCNPRKIMATFYLKSDPRVSLEREIIVKKSCRPTAMKLFFTNPRQEIVEYIEIHDKKVLEFPAGNALSGVFFKAYDCDGSEIVLPELGVNCLSVSWESNNGRTYKNGELPNIVMPTLTGTQEQRFIEWKELNKKINLRHSFILRSYADSPDRLSVDCAEKPLVFPLGEVVRDDIVVTVVDKYNNYIRSEGILNKLIISADSGILELDETHVKKSVSRGVNEGSFIINGIKLLPIENINSNDQILRKSELCFKIRGNERVRDYLTISVVNGIPKSFMWFNQFHNSVVVVTNNAKLQLKARLCDDYRNPIVDSDLTAILKLGNHFLTPELTANLDSEGVAVFSEIIRINSRVKLPSKCLMPKEIQQNLQSCQKPCFGFTKILAEVHYNEKVIQTSPYWLHILCDSKTPAKFDITHIGSLNVITNTQSMPKIQVKVLAEDHSVIRDVDKKKIIMHLIDTEGNCLETPPIAINNTIFHFKPDKSPLPNKYKVKIIYNGVQTIERFYKQPINVIPGSPSKMEIKSQPLNDPIIVSNTETNRTIIDRSSPLLLELVDNSDVEISRNISAQELATNQIYSGNLRARIYHLDYNKNEVPELEGCDENKFVYFKIESGKAVVNELKLKPNTEGIDSQLYLVQIEALLNKSSVRVETFKFKILFCDDSIKQTQLEDLQMSINNDSIKKKEIDKELTKIESLEDSQRYNYETSFRKENQLRQQLRHLGEENELRNEQNIKSKIDEYMIRKTQLELNECNQTVRGINPSVAPQKDGIIGRIAHLAFIEDNETALIISWFLRNHMKCIVTKTSEEAEKLMNEMNEEIDLTLPLDQIRDTDYPKKWNDRLPHENRFDVSYNVGYARNRLQFNENIEQLHKVFGVLLNNTLIMDTIKDAKAYRKRFEKLGKCPTILTTKGYIYHGNGIIDKSAPLENFTSAAFQSPPNKELINVIQIIDLLQHLLKASKLTAQELEALNDLNKKYESIRKRKREDLENLNHSLSSSQSEFRRLSLSVHSNNNPNQSNSRSSLDSEPNSKRFRISH